MIVVFGGLLGICAGLVGAGFWDAFSLITSHAEPTSEQVTGLALGGGCTGVVSAVVLLIYLVVFEGA